MRKAANILRALGIFSVVLGVMIGDTPLESLLLHLPMPFGIPYAVFFIVSGVLFFLTGLLLAGVVGIKSFIDIFKD